MLLAFFFHSRMRCDGLEGAPGHSIDPSLLVLVVVDRNEEDHASWWAHEWGEWKSVRYIRLLLDVGRYCTHVCTSISPTDGGTDNSA